MFLYKKRQANKRKADCMYLISILCGMGAFGMKIQRLGENSLFLWLDLKNGWLCRDAIEQEGVTLRSQTEGDPARPLHSDTS